MRLIDADAVLKGKNDHEMISTHIIWNAPTIDAEPVRHAHWVEQENDDWRYSKEYRCSECGKYRLVTNPVGWEWHYCPHCGAKMDEVTE